jgi:alkanesulfonate monooxygenase SsuD/methylene tetrahydromethanopterin reductase-like flavin-dependent oxidoreductase (luciferase family)
MRIGIVVDPTSWDAACRDVADARRAGLDLVWLPARDDRGERCSAPVLASALAPGDHGLNLVVEVEAGTHPIGLAEELAVADQALGGRVTGVLAGDDVPLVTETLQVLRAGLRSRPFRHRGERWTLPADQAGTVRVTPAPAQLRLPLWLRGSTLAGLAAGTGSALVDDGAEHGGVEGGDVRPALRGCPLAGDGTVDVGAAVALLREARDDRGVDVCCLSLDPGLDATQRSLAIRRLGDRVRPQLQLSELPVELIASWDAPSAVDGP